MLPTPNPRTRCHDERRLRPRSCLTPPPSHPFLAPAGALCPAFLRPQPRSRSPGLAANFCALGSGAWTLGPRRPPLSSLPASGPKTSGTPPESLLPSHSLSKPCFGEGLFRSGDIPRVCRAPLALLFRLHLDIIFERSCPQDDHAGRRCAQDDAARAGAELPAQRIPAGR